MRQTGFLLAQRDEAAFLAISLRLFGDNFSARAFPPLEDVASTLGEVIVSVDRARAQARERDLPLREEVARLVIHGLLHLAGHDHQRPPERRRMRAREEAWLAAERGGRGWLRPS